MAAKEAPKGAPKAAAKGGKRQLTGYIKLQVRLAKQIPVLQLVQLWVNMV